MSYFNTSFSSLEDAWGENFSRKTKGKSVKSKDPICNLYNQRKRSSSIPYTQNKEEVEDVMYPTESYDKYHGYEDAHRYSRKPSRVSTYRSSLPTKKHPPPPSPEPYDSEEEHGSSTFRKRNVLPSHKKKPSVRRSTLTKNDHEKISLDRKRATNMDSLSKQKRGLHRGSRQKQLGVYEDSDSELDYAPYSDDDSSSIIEEEMDQYHLVRNKHQYSDSESDSDVESESEFEPENTTHELFKTKAKYDAEKEYASIMKENKFTTVSCKEQTNTLSKNTYADVLLFTITGILLIFIMEQFVQIGMKLKK